MQNSPLLVHIIFHSDAWDAQTLARHILVQLNNDSNVPGLRVPIQFCPVTEDAKPPEKVKFEPGYRHFVLLLANDEVAGDDDWCQFSADIWQACQNSPNRCIPVQLSEYAWPLDDRLELTNFVRGFNYSDIQKQQTAIVRRTLIELCRYMHGDAIDDKAPQAPTKVFISHTKMDINSDPQVVDALKTFLNQEQPIKTWFDSGDIAAGSTFSSEIEKGIKDSSLLCVLTNNYASREWCRKEILLAKIEQRPIVVIDAIMDKEIRSFPYLGNLPVIRWSGDPGEAIDLLLKETLRDLLVRSQLSDKRPDDHLMTRPPELLTLISINKGSQVYYPDPPLGLEEKNILDKLNINMSTPLERIALNQTLLDLKIALSISPSTDINKNGLDKLQQEQFAKDLSLYLILKGVKLVYGGHLGSDGYTEQLFEMIRSHSQNPMGSVDILDNYVGWPIPFTSKDRAKYKSLINLIRVERPADISEKLDADFIAKPKFFAAKKSAMHRFAWARGMTEMRIQQTKNISARIVVGGPFAPTVTSTPEGEKKETWYQSRIPGILEEVMFSIEAGQPIFLIGAFGGMAEVIIDILEGIDRPEMSWEFQKDAPYAPQMKQLYIDKGLKWVDYLQMANTIKTKGISGINPMLTEAENKQLFHCKDTNKIIQLVLKGLDQCNGTKLSS